MKIVISAIADAYDRETEELIVDSQRLSRLDGLRYDDDLYADYLSEALYEIGIVGGQIELSYKTEESKLTVVTSYHAPRKLKKDELRQLVDETAGQWSDGIGEGEFQHAAELGIVVDISPLESRPQVEQFDDGVVVRKPRKSELVKLLEARPVDEQAAIELVKRGAAIDAKNRFGQSVLELACRAVRPKLVEILLKRGALDKAETPHRALATLSFCQSSVDVMEKSAIIARWLLERGVDVDASDEDGRTPLMMAVNRNNMPLVKCLLAAGADVNRQQSDEDNQCSALMFARDAEMVRFLLENGADPNICTACGMNAYEVQMRNTHQSNCQELAAIIQSYLK